MASPHVAGVAALIWGRKSNLSYKQIKDILLDNVDVIQSLVGKVATWGRLNAYKAIIKVVPPAEPSNLNAYPTAWDEIKLMWQDNSDNEDGFKIERKTNSSEYSQIGTTGQNGTVYNDNTVSAGVMYYYRVRAYNVYGGNSPYSTPDDAQVPTGKPVAPSFIEGQFLWSTHEVELTWSDSSNNEQGFAIERKSEYEPSWEEIDRVGPNVNVYYDPNIMRDTIYRYRVRAYNPSGYSPYSSVAVVYVPWY